MSQPTFTTTTQKRTVNQQHLSTEQCTKKSKLEHVNTKQTIEDNNSDSDEENNVIDIFDDEHDELFYQDRTIPYDMLEQLCSWIEQSNMPKEDVQRWMSQIYVWNEAYQGCRDNENHWFYRSEEPEIAEAFIKVHNNADINTFKQLGCFEK